MRFQHVDPPGLLLPPLPARLRFVSTLECFIILQGKQSAGLGGHVEQNQKSSSESGKNSEALASMAASGTLVRCGVGEGGGGVVGPLDTAPRVCYVF